MGIYPKIYPPVGPTSTESPLAPPLKTGSPTIPSNMYIATAAKEAIGGNMIAVNITAKSDKVMGIVPMGMEKGERTQITATINAVLVSVSNLLFLIFLFYHVPVLSGNLI